VADGPPGATHLFKLVLGSVVGLTAAFAGAAIALAYFPPHGDASLADSFMTIVKMGTGAVFGLMGGRATA
jgi:hypothetical protein